MLHGVHRVILVQHPLTALPLTDVGATRGAKKKGRSCSQGHSCFAEVLKLWVPPFESWAGEAMGRAELSAVQPDWSPQPSAPALQHRAGLFLLERRQPQPAAISHAPSRLPQNRKLNKRGNLADLHLAWGQTVCSLHRFFPYD